MAEKNGVLTFAGTKPESLIPEKDLCTVLYGYGKESANKHAYVDIYEFVGGVGRNIPRSIAMAWAKGVRPDGQPAISRVYIQAVLPNDADEAAFVQATGIQIVETPKFAAMIKATEASQLLEMLGREEAVKMADALLKAVGEGKK